MMEEVNYAVYFLHALMSLSLSPQTVELSLLARGIPGRVIFETTGLNHIARDFQWLTRRKHKHRHSAPVC